MKILTSVIKIDDIIAHSDKIAWHLFNAHIYEHGIANLGVRISLSKNDIKEDIMKQIADNSILEINGAKVMQLEDNRIVICIDDEYMIMKEYEDFKREVSLLLVRAIKTAQMIAK